MTEKAINLPPASAVQADERRPVNRPPNGRPGATGALNGPNQAAPKELRAPRTDPARYGDWEVRNCGFDRVLSC
jgi:hypothetical protein